MRNVFFIQRAAIDVLLLNKASALEICAYLVISKYTDRYGYYSGVGYKTIKERLGVGQKRVDEAITRLRSMEFFDQRLLYSLSEWIYLETGIKDLEKYKVGWVRGWFESEYKHQVWLSNDLVGCHGGPDSPLKYFIPKKGNRDNHARLLLLMYKYCNRQYAGVNHKFASITTEAKSSYKINNVTFQKSSLDDYHISRNIIKKLSGYISKKEICAILDELQESGFVNVSVSAIGNHDGPDISAGKQKKLPVKTDKEMMLPIEIKKRYLSEKQKKAYREHIERLEAYKRLKRRLKGARESFELGIKNSDKIGENRFYIKLKRVLKTTRMHDFKPIVYDNLMNYPGQYGDSASKFVYRLDYKSIKKKNLKLDDCLAIKVEDIAKRNGLESASRKGKFYKSYWWFDPGVNDIALVGVLMPLYTPYTELVAYSGAHTVLDEMIDSESYTIDKIDDIDCSDLF